MGKHEAPSTSKKRTSRHAAPADKGKLPELKLPEVKLPQVKLPKIDREKLPKMQEPDWQSFRAFFERLAGFGMKKDASGTHKRSYSFSRDQVYLTAGPALLFFLLWLLPTHGWLRFVLYLLPFLLLGAFTFQDAIREVLDGTIPGRNLLISVAALGFLCLGQVHAAVFILLIHRVFILLESYLFEKKASLEDKLKEILPDTAVAETEDGLERRGLDTFDADDIVFVPTGDLIPFDGQVVEGISSLDASPLCGESNCLDVGVNSFVFAGCRNLTNPLRIRVTAARGNTLVDRFVNRVRKSARTEPARSSLLQTILSWLPTALAILGVILALIVSLATKNWSAWLYRGLLLIALAGCGDTLLSARLAYFSGVYDAAKEGISYLDADVIDKLASSDLMIFSKTGTVTEGRYSVVGVYPVEYEEKDLLTIAALAECQSMHPIARALRDACGIEVHHRSDITLLEETPGRGIHTLFGGRNVYVGNSTLLMDHNIVFDVPSHKGTVIHVAVDNKYAGCIVLNDRVREGCFDAVEELRQRGIRAAVMLTGDVRSMARPIASSLGFDMVKCELSNEAKAEALDYLRDSKGNSAAITYVSSKAEDLELLKKADVGIAFSVLSETKPMDEASVLIMGDRVFLIPQALYMAKRITIAALLGAAVMLGLELLLIILGMFGAVSVWLAMLLILIARLGTLIYTFYFK